MSGEVVLRNPPVQPMVAGAFDDLSLPSIYSPLIGQVVNVVCEDGRSPVQLTGVLKVANDRAIVLQGVARNNLKVTDGILVIPSDKVLRLGPATQGRIAQFESIIGSGDAATNGAEFYW